MSNWIDFYKGIVTHVFPYRITVHGTCYSCSYYSSWCKVKQVVGTSRPRLGHATKTNFVTCQTVDIDVCSILTIQRVWE